MSNADIERRSLEILLHGYWHAGSGLGSAAGVDAQVIRTPAGLPYLPGRTLKGILREAVETARSYGWIAASEADVEGWFGKPLVARRGRKDVPALDLLEEERFKEGRGTLRVESARLGRDQDSTGWEIWARWPAHGPQRDMLFRALACTAVDDDGVASDATLRLVEAAVPLTLYADLEGPPAALDVIAAALPLVRSVGAHHTRGMGRATLRLGEPCTR